MRATSSSAFFMFAKSDAAAAAGAAITVCAAMQAFTAGSFFHVILYMVLFVTLVFHSHRRYIYFVYIPYVPSEGGCLSPLC